MSTKNGTHNGIRQGNGTRTRFGSPRRHGYREVRQNICIEELMVVVGRHPHLDMLCTLMDGPKCVTAIANALFLRLNGASRELSTLEQCGLVRWTRAKTNRIYSLTDRVRAVRKDDIVKVMISDGDRNCFMIYLDENFEPLRDIPHHAATSRFEQFFR